VRLARPALAATTGVLIAATALFQALVFGGIRTDIQAHALWARRVFQGELDPPANFLYYLAIHVASGLQTGIFPLLWASVAVLALAVAARFALSSAILGETGTRPGVALGLAAALLLAFSLPTHDLAAGRWLLGGTPPNVWHNSTTIALMPFAMALFRVSHRALREPTPERDVAIATLSLLNVLVKPSFFFAFAIVYPCLVLRETGVSRRLWRRLWPVAFGAAWVGVQYLALFGLGIASTAPQQTGVRIEPFAIWSAYSSNIPVSVLASTLFPAAHLLLRGRDLRDSLLLRYALLLYLVSIALMALLAETGPRRWHGNFFWQSFVACQLLFVSAAALLGPRLSVRPVAWRDRILLAVLGLHTIAGIAYLARLLVARTYA
jgi:hypothetical protein